MIRRISGQNGIRGHYPTVLYYRYLCIRAEVPACAHFTQQCIALFQVVQGPVCKLASYLPT
jgi:hypothetical protein